jgi:hypothetical protein
MSRSVPSFVVASLASHNRTDTASPRIGRHHRALRRWHNPRAGIRDVPSDARGDKRLRLGQQRSDHDQLWSRLCEPDYDRGPEVGAAVARVSDVTAMEFDLAVKKTGDQDGIKVPGCRRHKEVVRAI